MVVSPSASMISASASPFRSTTLPLLSNTSLVTMSPSSLVLVCAGIYLRPFLDYGASVLRPASYPLDLGNLDGAALAAMAGVAGRAVVFFDVVLIGGHQLAGASWVVAREWPLDLHRLRDPVVHDLAVD